MYYALAGLFAAGTDPLALCVVTPQAYADVDALADIATNYGNPIVATADGIVISLGNDKMGGKNIVISHGGGVTTHYLHLSKFLIKSGQRVKRGDVIGLVGKTGKARGPHLHYEVRVNNRPVNPYNYILEEE